MEKKRLLVSYDKLPPQVLRELNKKYPSGFNGHLTMFPGPKPFYGLLFELEDSIYLIKINPSVLETGEPAEDLVPEEDLELEEEMDE